CGSSSSSMVLTTNATIGPIAALAGSDQCLPSGTITATLAGNNPSPGVGTWTEASGNPVTITNPNLYNTTVTGLSNGTYTFAWSIARNACTITSDTMMITISANATTANAGSTQNICGTSCTLAGNNPSIGTGTWTQTSGIGGATITSPNVNNSTVTGLMNGSYTFKWTISN